MYDDLSLPEPCAVLKKEDIWIDNWVQKVNSLKTKDIPAPSVALKPVLQALGVSDTVVDALKFNSNTHSQISPVQVEIQLPLIPNVDFKSDPVEYQNALLNKIKILQEALDKLKNAYMEETSQRKNMENSVAQITSSIVKGLEQVEGVIILNSSLSDILLLIF